MATSIPLIHSNVGDSYTTPVDVTQRAPALAAASATRRTVYQRWRRPALNAHYQPVVEGGKQERRRQQEVGTPGAGCSVVAR